MFTRSEVKYLLRLRSKTIYPEEFGCHILRNSPLFIAFPTHKHRPERCLSTKSPRLSAQTSETAGPLTHILPVVDFYQPAARTKLLVAVEWSNEFLCCHRLMPLRVSPLFPFLAPTGRRLTSLVVPDYTLPVQLVWDLVSMDSVLH